VLQKSDIRDRKVSRHSEMAIKALNAIGPDEVYDAVMQIIDAA
jgi:hypothetical protein